MSENLSKAQKIVCGSLGAAVELYRFIRQAIYAFIEDNAVRKAAALAFYAMFSTIPAFLLALNVAGVVIGTARAESELTTRLELLINHQSADYVTSLLKTFSAELRNSNLSIIAISGAVLAGTAVFVELQSSLNAIWGFSLKRKNGFWLLLRSRIISFVLVVGLGILLLAAVITNTVLTAISSFFVKTFFVPTEILKAVNLITQFGMVPVLLILIYKLVPDGNLDWKGVLLGSGVASFLFLIGKHFLGIYLSSSLLQSVYGAAGSLFLLLVWVYYSAQVFYFGAELTKVYEMRYGSRANQDIAERFESAVNDQ